MASPAGPPTTLWLACLVLPAILAPRAYAATIRVPADQPTIQAGIDAAQSGDVVLVAAGAYTGSHNKNLDFRSKDIAVRGESGPEVTTIDCEGNGRGFFLLGPLTPAATIDGLTIMNGDAAGGEAVGGGAMFIAGGGPTIENCHFVHNTAVGLLQNGGGGAISLYNAGAAINRCVFIENAVSGSSTIGGALAIHQSHGVSVSDCRFERNVVTVTSGGGGGIGVASMAPDMGTTIKDCEFLGNEARIGGGVFGDQVQLINCRFEGNRAREGGGASVLSSEVTACLFTGNVATTHSGGAAIGEASAVVRCVFTKNLAVEGGGIRCVGFTTLISDCLIAHNVATRGGGVAAALRPCQFLNCTIARNEAEIGSGVFLTSREPATWVFENTVIEGGGTGEAIRCEGLASAVLTCSDVFGNRGGDWVGCIEGQKGVRGNFAVDPWFCGPSEENFTLAANSPCLPGNHPQGIECGLIGAFGEGCGPVQVEGSTWGAIKARYRD